MAAKRAGYSGDDNALGVAAWRLLRNDKIKDALKLVFESMAMDTQEMFALLRKIAIDNDEKTSDRLRAMELIGRGHAAFTDNVKGDTTLNIRVIRDE